MVHILSGTATLVEGDTCTPMHPGDTASFKAGTPIGHRLRNDSEAPVRYVVIGTRSGDDVVTCPLTGDTVTIRDGVRTCRDAAWTITKTAPYHGA